MTNEEIYLNKLKRGLEQISSDYEYIITWNSQFIHNYTNDPDNASKRVVNIVLTEMPSVAYGDGDITQSIIMDIECEQRDLENVFMILKTYQNNVFNQKIFIDYILINESYYSPQIIDPMEEIGVGYLVRMQMTGSVAFSHNICDIQEIKVNNEKVKYLMFNETITGDTLPNLIVGEAFQKATNRSRIYRVELKVVNTNSDFCIKCRQFKYDHNGANTKFALSIKYSDNEIYTKDMIITNVSFQTSDGILPTIVVSLVEDING